MVRVQAVFVFAVLSLLGDLASSSLESDSSVPCFKTRFNQSGCCCCEGRCIYSVSTCLTARSRLPCTGPALRLLSATIAQEVRDGGVAGWTDRAPPARAGMSTWPGNTLQPPDLFPRPLPSPPPRMLTCRCGLAGLPALPVPAAPAGATAAQVWASVADGRVRVQVHRHHRSPPLGHQL